MKNILLSLKNASKTNQGSFEGWGTSLCWWANRVGFSKKLTDESARLFFSEEGLGLNIMRYNIGGGDDPTHNHIKRTDSEMPGWWRFSQDDNDYAFSPDNDTNQLNVLEAAYKASGENAYVEAFSNSPPFFMTVSGCSSGAVIAATNNLKRNCITPFSEYLAEVCRYINDEKSIRIKSLAPMNEPFTNYWKANSPKQEGCFISPGKMQSELIIATNKALKKYKLDNIIVTASDETNTVLQYISMKMLSPQALKSVGRISTHTYMKATSHIKRLCEENNKNLWMSESDWSGVSGKNSGEMGPALWLSLKIIEDINTFSPSAWVIWQIMAGYISKIPDAKGRVDAESLPDLTKGYWGTAFPDIDNEIIYLTQKYYAFGQFTKYIKPGMTIINTDDNNILGAYDKESGKVIIVAVNSEENTEEISFSSDSFNFEGKTMSVIRTSGSISDGEHNSLICKKFLNSGTISEKLIKHSITTFIIQ